VTREFLLAAIEAHFDVVRDRCTHDEIAIICPEKGCNDSSGNRYVNVRTGRTNCWKCSIGGSFVKWARGLGYDIEDDREANITEAVSSLDSLDLVKKKFIPSSSDVTLPGGFIQCAKEPTSVYTKLIEKMAVRKRLTMESFFEHGVGFTRSDSTWEPFAIFPIMEYDRLVYYQGRKYAEEAGEATKRFPNRQVCPFGSKNWVYNIDAARSVKPGCVVLVEAILSVMSLEKKFFSIGKSTQIVPLGVFKHFVSYEQVVKILKLKGVEEICIMFDADSTEAAWKAAESFVNHKTVTVVKLPEVDGNKKFDPNDNVDIAWDCFVDRKKYGSNAVSRMMLEVDRI